MPNSKVCAQKIIEIVPMVMQMIRAELRHSAKMELSVPQFRILARLHSGSNNIGELAEWIGVSVPAMSRMVDGLVQKNYIQRVRSAKDRREQKISLTSQGLKLHLKYKKMAQDSIANKMAELSLEKKIKLIEGLETLENSYSRTSR